MAGKKLIKSKKLVGKKSARKGSGMSKEQIDRISAANKDISKSVVFLQ